jgi:hypothetical protein
MQRAPSRSPSQPTAYVSGGVEHIGQAAYLFGIRAHFEGRLVGDGSSKRAGAPSVEPQPSWCEVRAGIHRGQM